MLSALALTLLGLIQADVAEAATSEHHALVVVALPANAKRAIVEALHRLRGEATAVGFDVRFVEAGTEAISVDWLDTLSSELRPAAVVSFADWPAKHSGATVLDVRFMDRSSGRTSVAHLEADKLDEGEERSDVLLAVRAVDFVRARMFDTLVGRRAEPPRPAEAHAQGQRGRPLYAALGASVLGSAGFSPAFVPQVELAYQWIDWSRIGVSGFAFGTRPEKGDDNGTASVDLRYVGINVTWLGPRWRRLRSALDTGVGEYWVRVRGQPLAANAIGRDTTLSSPGANANLRLGFAISPRWSFDVLAGAVWLRSRVEVNSTADTFLGTVGMPLWLASTRLGASF